MPTPHSESSKNADKPGSRTRRLRQAKLSGDPRDVAEVVQHAGNSLRRLARGKLKQTHTGRVNDENDVVQSVARILVTHPHKLANIKVDNRKHLNATLAKMTNDKIIDYRRRDNRRTETESEVAFKEDGQQGNSPADAASDRIQMQELLALFTTLPERNIAELVLTGGSEREIVEKLGVTRYQVSKVRKRLQNPF